VLEAVIGKETPSAVALYRGPHVITRVLDLEEVRAQTRQHETHPRNAGYQRWRGDWHLALLRWLT
jgi:hypothetical protein